MSEEKWVIDFWPNEHCGLTYTCLVCHAIVSSEITHREWHKELKALIEGKN